MATNLNLRQNSICSGLKFSSESKLFGQYLSPLCTTSATLPRCKKFPSHFSFSNYQIIFTISNPIFQITPVTSHNIERKLNWPHQQDNHNYDHNHKSYIKTNENHFFFAYSYLLNMHRTITKQNRQRSTRIVYSVLGKQK